MTNNKRAPTFPSPNSNNLSVQTKLGATLSGSSSVMGGDKRGDLVLNNTSKKTRGRPIGSKNREKAPIILSENTDNLMELIIIEIPSGNDVVGTLINLAHCYQAGITVLSASGLVSNVTLLQPMCRAPNIPIEGTYQMISLSGTYMHANSGRVPPQLIAEPACSSFSIFVNDNCGNYMFGGIVAGKVKAASVVMITAALFKNPEFHRLAIINGIFEEDGTKCVGGVIPNVDDFSFESNEMLPADVDVDMEWNRSPST